MKLDIEVRKGNQNPTIEHTIEYENTFGNGAIELYNSTGRTAQPWQEQIIYDILATNEDGLWTHTKYGWSVPRRNGKSEILIMRELYGLQRGERILHTAHRTTTSHNAWEKLCELLAQTGLVEGENYRTIKQFGLERIEMFDKKGKIAGRINFRTRSSKGGLGEGYDLLIIDEAQEYTDDQESALKYVVTDSKNPQTLFCGTPPTPVSSGTVFTKYRKDTLTGKKPNSGWAEWSVDRQSDVNDVELWYKTNPSLGTIFTERSITDEITSDVVDFNIQRLGWWIEYNQKSAISKTEWQNVCVDKLPQLEGGLYIGIKFGVDGINAALGIAAKTTSGQVFVEVVDCRPIRNGIGWMLPYLRNPNVGDVVVDGAIGVQQVKDMMENENLPQPIVLTVKELVSANAVFENAIFSGGLCHKGQPALSRMVENCDHRAIGNQGGFGYKSILIGAEIALIDCVMLAHWLAYNAKDEQFQEMGF